MNLATKQTPINKSSTSLSKQRHVTVHKSAKQSLREFSANKGSYVSGRHVKLKVTVAEWQCSVRPHGGVLVISTRRAWFLHTTDKAEVPSTCAGRVMCHFQQLWSLKPAALLGTQICPKDMTTDSESDRWSWSKHTHLF